MLKVRDGVSRATQWSSHDHIYTAHVTVSADACIRESLETVMSPSVIATSQSAESVEKMRYNNEECEVKELPTQRGLNFVRFSLARSHRQPHRLFPSLT